MVKNVQQLIKTLTSETFPAFIHTLAETEHPKDHWEHTLLPEEMGIEILMEQIAQYGQKAYISAAAAAARLAYPIVIECAGEEAWACGFHEEAPSMDGDTEGMKIKKVEQWLKSPSEALFHSIDQGIDGTRQLDVWDEDINPGEYNMWWWFMAVGQLCALSVVNPEEEITDQENALSWPGPICATRCVLTAFKSIRKDPDRLDLDGDLLKLGKVIGAGLKVNLL